MIFPLVCSVILTNAIMNHNRIYNAPYVMCEDWVKSRVKNTIEWHNKNMVESRFSWGDQRAPRD